MIPVKHFVLAKRQMRLRQTKMWFVFRVLQKHTTESRNTDRTNVYLMFYILSVIFSCKSTEILLYKWVLYCVLCLIFHI